MTKRALRKSIESKAPALAGRAWLVWWLQERRRRRVAAAAVMPPPTDMFANDLGTYIEYGWTPPAVDYDEVRVYRKVNAGSYSLYLAASPESTLAEDHDVVVGSAYRYYATAYSALLGESAPSNEALVVFGS